MAPTSVCILHFDQVQNLGGLKNLGGVTGPIVGTMVSSVRLSLYCDEIKEVHIRDPVFGNEKWAYIGVLIVQASAEQELIARLLERRCGNPLGGKKWGGCSPQCAYHAKNNKEVHYQELDSVDKYFIASRWLDFMLADTSLTHFYILGIDLSKLDFARFGEGTPAERFRRVYNRFFRTAILKSVKSYFHRFQRIVIAGVVHDNTGMRHSDYFPWHAIYRIGTDDPKVEFECSQIEFLDSDHRVSGDERSHLLQYIDLILGSSYNALHWASHQDRKTQVALGLVPLLERLMHAPGNVNSRFRYVGRMSVDFFPARSFASLTQWERRMGEPGHFYKARELRVKRFKQPTLFDQL